MAERVFTQTFGVVGAIIERDGKFLLVQEAKPHIKGKWSLPAGWLEVGEDPLDGVRREVKEETGYDFAPTHVLGLYSLHKIEQEQAAHGLKIFFVGTISDAAKSSLSDDVSAVRWFSSEEIAAMGETVLRSVDLKKMIRDYLEGVRYPLELITHSEVVV